MNCCKESIQYIFKGRNIKQLNEVKGPQSLYKLLSEKLNFKNLNNYLRKGFQFKNLQLIGELVFLQSRVGDIGHYISRRKNEAKYFDPSFRKNTIRIIIPYDSIFIYFFAEKKRNKCNKQEILFLFSNIQIDLKGIKYIKLNNSLNPYIYQLFLELKGGKIENEDENDNKKKISDYTSSVDTTTSLASDISAANPKGKFGKVINILNSPNNKIASAVSKFSKIGGNFISKLGPISLIQSGLTIMESDNKIKAFCKEAIGFGITALYDSVIIPAITSIAVANPVLGACLGGLYFVHKYVLGNLYGKIFDGFFNKEKKMAGVEKPNSTGGVEFDFPKQIHGFKNKFFINCKTQINKIIFECDKHGGNILETANRFIDNSFKFKNINEIFQTILSEIYIGYIGYGVMPLVSLNFNKNSLLYSVMHGYYKLTLTGHILGFLDYFLKGFVNGGFFYENFVENWYKIKNLDIEYLNNNFENLKKYLYKNKNNLPQNFQYLTTFDLGDEIEKNNETLCAFRIIGTINDVIFSKHNILYPQCSYRVENDFNILPKLFSEIQKDKSIKNKIEKSKEAHLKMKLIVQAFMSEIPYFKGYFQLLNMITFAIHLVPNLQNLGLFPRLTNSIFIKNNGKKYLKEFPPVFPPLPIRQKIKINPSIKFSESLNYFLDNEERKILNTQLYNSAFGKKTFDFGIIEKITNKMKKKYREYLFTLYYDKSELEYRSDEELHVNEFIKSFIIFIKSLASFPGLKINNLFDLYSKEIKKLFPKYIIKTKNCKNIENIEEKKILLDNIFKELLTLSEYFYNQNKNKMTNSLNSQKKEEIMKLNQKREENFEQQKRQFLNDLDKNPDIKKALSYNRNDINQKIEQYKKENIDNIRKNINQHWDNQINNINDLLDKEINKKVEESRNNYFKSINELKKEYFKNINDIIKILKTKNILDFANKFDKEKLCEEIHLTKLGFVKNDKESFSSIRGGCIVEKNNSLILVDNEDILSESFISLINSSNKEIVSLNKKNDEKHYICVELKLNRGYISDNIWKLLDISKETKMDKVLSPLINGNYININEKDDYGCNSGFYKIISGNPALIDTLRLDESNCLDNFGHSLHHYAAISGNIFAIKKLINLSKEGFNNFGENDINALLMLINKNNVKLLNILIPYLSISTLNHSTEIGMTPLHLACLLNLDSVVLKLLRHGAELNSQERKYGNSPLHICCENGNYESISIILGCQNLRNIINFKRPDGKTPLHLACQESFISSKMLINHRDIKLDIKDIYNQNPLYTSFFIGRIDIYLYIIFLAKGADILFKNLIIDLNNKSSEELYCEKLEKCKSRVFNLLCKKMEEGDLIAVQKISSFILNHKDLKNKIISSSNLISNLIESACKGRIINYLEILSKLVDLKQYPIGSFVGKYSLINWIKELNNIGIDFYFKNSEEKDILDYILLKENYLMLFRFLEEIDSISDEKLTEIFNVIIKTKDLIIFEEFNKLLSHEKFKNNKISLLPLCQNKYSLPLYFSLSSCFEKVDMNSLNIDILLENCSYEVLLTILKDPLFTNKLSLKEIFEKSKYKKRTDICFFLMKNFQELKSKYYNNLLSNIETSLENLEILLRKENQNILGEVFEYKEPEIKNLIWSLDFKQFENWKFPNENTLLPHLIVKSRKIWAFKYLPDGYNIFIQDNFAKNCFDYFLYGEIQLKQLYEYFKNNIKGFLTAIEIIANNKENSIEIIRNQLIKGIFKEFEENINIFFEENDKGKTLLSIISELTLFDESIEDLIIKKLEEIDKLGKITQILNKVDIYGNTILINLILSEHLSLVFKIIERYINIISFDIKNDEGNTLLHYIFYMIDYNKYQSNTPILINLFEIVKKILIKNKNVILLENNNGLTPWLIAFKSGINNAIFLMTQCFSYEKLNSSSKGITPLHIAAFYNQISTIRFLVENYKIDLNLKTQLNSDKNKKYQEALSNTNYMKKKSN